MILYPKDPNNSTKHLDLINTFSELAEYKIKMENLDAFLYTNNKFVEKDTRKKNLDHNKIKFLGLKLTQKVKHLCNEEFKILKKLKTLKD